MNCLLKRYFSALILLVAIPFQVKANCDFSSAPNDGQVGNCTASLNASTFCMPFCDNGFRLSGVSRCDASGEVESTAECSEIIPPQPTICPILSLVCRVRRDNIRLKFELKNAINVQQAITKTIMRNCIAKLAPKVMQLKASKILNVMNAQLVNMQLQLT